MREKYVHAGKTVKVKDGVGEGLNGQDFVIEDWCENVLGCSWKKADGNPAALNYAVRHSMNGDNNGVPVFSDDVVYGKIENIGYLFHVNELVLDGLENTNLVKLKFLRNGEPSGREYTYICKSEVAIVGKVEETVNIEELDQETLCEYCKCSGNYPGPDVKGGPDGPIYPSCADGDINSFFDKESYLADLKEREVENHE